MKQGVWRKLVAALTPLAVLGVVVLVGCVDEDDSPKRTTPPFPHKRHLEELEDLGSVEERCAACHKDAKKADEAGMPTIKNCAKCHAGTDEKKKPNELQTKGFIKDDRPVWSSLTAIPKEVKFSHKLHGDAKVKCISCHKGIENSKLVSSQLRVTMPDCVACHAKVSVGAGAKDNCKLCHTYVSKEWRPPNHEKNWKELHGRYSGFVRRGSNQSCSLCHTDKSCTACHRVEQPKSHTNYWRLRGHGVTADLDRSSCKACHTEDFCVRCHQSVTPQSHRGNWDNQHCLGCHFPLRDNSCFVCHKNDIRHRIAPNLPSTQVHKQAQSSDCRNCHGGLKRPHLDNGDDCLLCHRR